MSDTPSHSICPLELISHLDRIHCRYRHVSDFFTNPRIDAVSDIARALKPGGVLIIEEVNVRTVRTRTSMLAVWLTDRVRLRCAAPKGENWRSTNPDCPVLAAIQRRIKSRYAFAGWKQPKVDQEDPLEPVRTHPAFRASAQMSSIDFSLGTRPGQGQSTPKRLFSTRAKTDISVL